MTSTSATRTASPDPTMTDSAARWAPHVTDVSLTVPGLGDVDLRTGGRDRTRPFLLLHGGAGPESVTGFADLLAAREFARVIVPTHPGFAGTPRPDTLASCTDLARVYVALLDELDLWDVTVVGNSLGGWIAAEVALQHSPRVSGLIMIDAVGAEVPGEPVTDIRELSPQDLVDRSFADPARFAPTADTAPSPDLVRANLAALFTYGGETMTDPTLLDRLRGLDLPAHVIWGAADRIVTPANGRAIADALPTSHFTLLPDAGHLPQVEAPEQLLAAITQLGADLGKDHR